MEHESFEDPATAEMLNRDFVPVKLDREERPDVDRVYMTFVQATTGSGGWPMSVWLTPDLEPFYGGTYFPPTPQHGRPAFKDVLQEIARAWREERADIEGVGGGRSCRGSPRSAAGTPPAGTVDGAASSTRPRRQFEQSFDEQRGGFGDQPKFPRPSELLFLLREHARTGEDRPAAMVLQTLRAMAIGGMRDHIGGGFHRYSVDGSWRVPHFEKMLYDQAQLVLAYLEASQAARRSVLRADRRGHAAVRGARDDRRSGGFYSAEDADSVPPETVGRAGRTEDGRRLLRVDDRRGAARCWAERARPSSAALDSLPGGNAPFDPHDEFAGKNILYTAQVDCRHRAGPVDGAWRGGRCN